MAEGALRVLLEKERPDKFEVLSCGTHAGGSYPATEYAVEVAKLWNADLSKHRSQPLSVDLIERSDLILAMTSEHLRSITKLAQSDSEKAYLFKNFPDQSPKGEPVDDPIGQALEKYNETFLEIGEFLGRFLPEIVERIDAKTDSRN